MFFISRQTLKKRRVKAQKHQTRCIYHVSHINASNSPLNTFQAYKTQSQTTRSTRTHAHARNHTAEKHNKQRFKTPKTQTR